MKKRMVRSAWVSLLGLFLVIPLVGCQADNEAGVMEPGKTGTADPRYAKGDDAAYEAYYKDQLKKAGSAPAPAPAESPKQ
jgi:hypothetical protein